MVFLTGDLGFMALEPLESALGNRFINAGVAEQNMISVSAAMAKDNWKPWCYSIAPFCFARPFEQIRNDICLHDLPVKLLGNGGGYGYGVMGPTHHAVEDYGILLTLPKMKVYIPCFNEDIHSVILSASRWIHPCYIRLGRGELPEGACPPPYNAWRHVLNGNGPVVIAVGPVAGSAWGSLCDLPESSRPNLWILSELPLVPNEIPAVLRSQIIRSGRILVIEEHVRQGGACSIIAHWLAEEAMPVKSFRSLVAAGLSLGVYGSQQFLRKHSGLDVESIRSACVTLGD